MDRLVSTLDRRGLCALTAVGRRSPQKSAYGMCSSRDQGPRLPALKRDLKPLRNRACDFVLDREDIFHLTIITLRPQVISVRGIHQLCGDAQPVVSSAHTSLENGAHVQL